MISFATEFPVNANRTTIDFRQAIIKWISGSPHTRMSADMLQDLEQKEDAFVKIDNESAQLVVSSTSDLDLTGIRYIKHEDNLDWQTTIVFSKALTDAWVGIRVECESSRTTARLPRAKKPVVVRILLEALGGSTDGLLRVCDRPHILTNDDVELAAKLIHGESDCWLPIIYVSTQFHGGYLLDVDRLASDLSGMAHVVIEPNRSFSLRLQHEVDSQNVYGGTIGIYWPQGGERRPFFIGRMYSTSTKLAQAINDEICSALLNRRPPYRCTWAYVHEIASQREIQLLKESGSQEVNDYIKTFDKEIEAKNQRLEEAEKQILYLRNQIQTHLDRTRVGGDNTLKHGHERDLYPNEIAAILLDAIKKAVDLVPADSRRKHVLLSIIKANTLEEDPLASRHEKLKRLLRGMRHVDGKLRRRLEDIGFSITEDGKHYKLVFQGDDRYTFTLPKSGSDWRGGLNAATNIAKLLF